MKRDKLLQHQLERLKRLLAPEIGRSSYGSVTVKGVRIMAMIHAAVCRSLRRYAKGYSPFEDTPEYHESFGGK